MALLTIQTGPTKDTVYDLLEPSISLGRDPSNTVQIPSNDVSRFHARMECGPDGWIVRDLGSRNGVLVNGRQVREAKLNSGDLIQLGGVVMQFFEEEAEVVKPEQLSDTTTLEVRAELRGAEISSPIPSEQASKAFQAILEVGGLVMGANGLSELFQRVTEVIDKHLKPHRTVPILFDPARGLLRPWVKAKSAFDAHLGRVPISSTIVKYVQERRTAVLSESTEKDERFKRSASILQHRITSAICAPLCIGDRLLGLLYADRLGRAESFTRRDLELLTAIATQVAVAVENVRFKERAGREIQVWDRQVRGQYSIIGESAAIQEVFKFIDRAAPTDAPVLIEGESGTGKELVARAIHYNSSRRRQPFEAVNCAALAPTLVESELFGHIKGAFTGADADRPGRFELADGGSLFLDEIGELPEGCQSKLLRVLEQGEVRRLGDVRDRPVNVRVIAATNKSLQSLVAEGRFREDLYFRLNVLRTVLPPLRERAGDIDLLAQHFLEHFRQKCGRPPMRFSPEVRELFRRYQWPGNIRELRNVVERMVVMAERAELTIEDVPYELRAKHPQASSSAPPKTLAEVEKEHILYVLRYTNGNKKEAARLLGIDRSTLYAKLSSYGMEP